MTTPVPAAPLVSVAEPRPLKEFSKNGFNYEPLLREGDVALYAQRRPGGGIMAYEVIIIRIAEATIIMGKEVPRREYGPSNEAFGTWGWSFPTLNMAKTRFWEVVARRSGAAKKETES